MPWLSVRNLFIALEKLIAILDVNNTLKPLDECATSIKVKQQLWTHLFNNERTRLKFKVAKILCQIFQYGCKDNSTTIPDVKWKTLRNEIELENIYQSKFYWRGRRADVLVINAGIEKKMQMVCETKAWPSNLMSMV